MSIETGMQVDCLSLFLHRPCFNYIFIVLEYPLYPNKLWIEFEKDTHFIRHLRPPKVQ